MDFKELIHIRESCRNFNPDREVSRDIIKSILEDARLSPSACNGQPYFLTVCEGDKAKEVAKATTGMGMNKFSKDAPALIVVSEKPYVKSAAMGAKIKDNDYRSIDIGIVTAHITLSASNHGISSCILGWFDEEKIKEICNIKERVRLVILLGYPADDKIRDKKRKNAEEISNIKKWIQD